MLSGCLQAQDASHDKQATFGNKKILIVYLSRTNNTKAIAQLIQKNVGGKLVALELVKPYPENYKAIVEQKKPRNKSGVLTFHKITTLFN